MKNIVTLVIAAVALVVLAGCTSGSTGSLGSAGRVKAEPPQISQAIPAPPSTPDYSGLVPTPGPDYDGLPPSAYPMIPDSPDEDGPIKAATDQALLALLRIVSRPDRDFFFGPDAAVTEAGHSVCRDLKAGKPYSAILDDLARSKFSGDGERASYFAHNAVAFMCRSQISKAH